MDKKQRNGLEVTCIGSLYQGPWEKKYWSSSRGKDRYPYPVGFHAVRCYNGQTYQMEIHEGARGPLFVVSFGEEMTCSGDTPTIAWQNVIKKLNLHSRKAQQRLLNSNSNGSELFGFLNPLVQRLFRELVSSQGGEAHQSDEPYEAMSQYHEEMNQEKMAADQDGSKTLSINLSWRSTKTFPVRKSRTSIVKSRNAKLLRGGLENSLLPREKKKPDTCKIAANNSLTPSKLEEADIPHPLRFCSPSGGRKRLKLLKSRKLAEQSSPNSKLYCSMLPDPDTNTSPPDLPVVQSDSEQYGPEQDGAFISELNSSSDLERQKVNSSLEDINASKAVNLETMAVVVPDSFENLSSQIPVRSMEQTVSSVPKHDSNNMLSFLDSHSNMRFPEDIFVVPDTFNELSQVYKKRGKEQELQTSSKIIPVLEKDLGKSRCLENKNMDSSQWIEEKAQLMNAVVLDSCDHDNNLSVLPKYARKSTGGATNCSQESLEAIPVDNMLSNHATESIVEAAITSQGLLEQILVDSKGSCHHSTLDNSQWSEDNMDKCDSDSLGQEITKSMMTLLLPQALHLLEKKRKRKNKSIIPSSMDEAHKLSDSVHRHNDDFDETKKFVYDDFPDTNINLSVDRFDGDIKDECNMVGNSYPQHSENGGCNSSVNRTYTKVASSEADKSSTLPCVTVKDLMRLDKEINASQDAAADGISRDADIANLTFSGKNDSKPIEMHDSPVGNLEKPDYLEPSVHGMLSQSSVDVHAVSENILRSGCGKVCPSTIHYLDAGPELPTDFRSTILEVNDALCHERTFISASTIETIELQQPDIEMPLCPYSFPENYRSSPGSNLGLPCSSSGCKRHFPQSINFKPKTCLEHPMPVLAVKVHVQDDDVRFFVLCGYPNLKWRILFLYRVIGKEVELSLINSINLNVLECGCDVAYLELVESNGICFTPDGEYLVLLGTVSVIRAREHPDTGSGLIPGKTKCCHGVKLISYRSLDASVDTELSSCGRHVYSLLACNPHMVIAGGEKGYVRGWEMDSIWRNCKENFILPVPGGCQLSHVIQLLAVPNNPSLVVGCDDQSLMAIWNIRNHQLLRTSTFSVVLPVEVYILDINVMSQQQNDPSKINTSLVQKAEERSTMNTNLVQKTEERSTMNTNLVQKTEETGDGITISLLFGTVDQNGSTFVSPEMQGISRTWNVEIFQRDGNSRVFLLDMDQRVSAMSIMDRLGIAGTYDGYVYIWDTVTGSIRQAYKDFEGVPIACIGSNWASDVVVVADVNGRVMLYMKQASM